MLNRIMQHWTLAQLEPFVLPTLWAAGRN